MQIDTLAPSRGSKKRVKRIGRGPGSGHGKTATKGHKGQKARSGGAKGPAFEGGQTPLQRRLPKRGFKNLPFKKEYAVINLKDIERLGEQDLITPEVIIQAGMIKNVKDGIKILGEGSMTRPLTIRAHAFSASALAKINAGGGKAEVVEH